MRRSKLTREMQLYSTGKNSQTKPLRKTNIHLRRQAQLTFPLAPSMRGLARSSFERKARTRCRFRCRQFISHTVVCLFCCFFQHLLTIALSSILL